MNGAPVFRDRREAAGRGVRSNGTELRRPGIVFTLGSIRDAVTAGVDTIEHASFPTSAGITADEELFDDIAASGVYISSTLGTPTDRLASMPEKMRGRLRTLRSLHRELHRRGARLIVGCDTGIGAFKPHDSLPYAVAELAGPGLSPTQARPPSPASRRRRAESGSGRAGSWPERTPTFSSGGPDPRPESASTNRLTESTGDFTSRDHP